MTRLDVLRQLLTPPRYRLPAPMTMADWSRAWVDDDAADHCICGWRLNPDGTCGRALQGREHHRGAQGRAGADCRRHAEDTEGAHAEGEGGSGASAVTPDDWRGVAIVLAALCALWAAWVIL